MSNNKQMLNHSGFFQTLKEDSIIKPHTYQSFIQKVKTMINTTLLNYFYYSENQLKQFYKKCAEDKESEHHKIALDHIIFKFIQYLRQTNKASIEKEINYYQLIIQGKLSHNIQHESRNTFLKIIQQYEGKFPAERILSDQLQYKVKFEEYVSLQKTKSFLQKIRNYLDKQQGNSKLILNNISSSQIQGHEIIQKILQSGIFKKKTLLERLKQYSDCWTKKMQFASFFIVDEDVSEQIQIFLRQINKFQNKLFDRATDNQDQITNLTKRQEQWKYQFDKLNDQLNLKQQLNYKHVQHVQQLQIYVQNIQKERDNLLKSKISLNGTIKEVINELNKMKGQFRQIQENYQQVAKENKELLKRLSNQKQMLQKLQQQKIIKDQKICALDASIDRNINLMQKKVYEQQQKTQEYLRLENQSQIFKASISNRRPLKEEIKSNFSKNSLSCGFKNSEINRHISSNSANSNKLQSQIKEQNTAQRIVLTWEEEPYVQQMSHCSKISNISAALLLPSSLSQEDIFHRVENALLSPQQKQNLTTVIKHDTDSEALQERFAMKEQRSQIQQPKSEYFMSKGVLININGDKIQTTILLTQKRFCFFDSNVRLVKFLPISNIKSFIFSRTNPTLFIIHPKNIDNLNPSEHFTNPLILSTRNRNGLVKYLTQRISNIVKQNNIQLITRYEDDVFFEIDKVEKSIKNQIPNMNNPCRLTLSQIPVFYCNLQEKGISNQNGKGSKNLIQAIVAVQPIGLICFQGKETHDIEKKVQLLYLLPLEDWNRSERKGQKEISQKEIKLIYHSQLLNKTFNFNFSSKQDLNLFIRACEQQLQSNQRSRAGVYKKLKRLFKQ